MTFKKKLLTAGMAALAILATAGAASAASATATANVNVRTGPGTSYGVVGTLMQGERVNVDQCRGSWCYVERRGQEGWVSANYLTSRSGWNNDNNGWGRPRPPSPPQWSPAPRPPHWNPGPPRPPQWNPRPPRPQPVYPVRPGGPNASFCFNGPNGYFCAGS
jgi:uncharacterized protein YraI